MEARASLRAQHDVQGAQPSDSSKVMQYMHVHRLSPEITQSSHSINAIGPAPHRRGRTHHHLLRFFSEICRFVFPPTRCLSSRTICVFHLLITTRLCHSMILHS
jgi:hypothetical protein